MFKKLTKVFLIISVLSIFFITSIASAALIPPPCSPFICPPPPPPPPVEPDPVVVLHGIGGSFNLDLFFSGLPFDHWRFIGSSYNDLIDSLVEAGYSTSTNLFTAFYDWRQVNNESAEEFFSASY